MRAPFFVYLILFFSVFLLSCKKDTTALSENQKVLSFFPEYVTPALEKRKHDITIEHLLTMRMGIANEHNNYMELYLSPNWIKAVIEFPLEYNPGTRFSYNTFQTHLLSAIITKAGGSSTYKFARQFLFEALAISVRRWEQDPQGYYFGGNNMFFTPRNMACLGYLYLNNGYLGGKQIIPAEWVKRSLKNYTGFFNNIWGDLNDVNYGYLWWLGSIKNYKVFLAIGHGGQFVINFPELDMIVVTTADAYVDWETADNHE